MSDLSGPSLRIDKLLFFLRLAPSRAKAAEAAEAGHIRIDGRRIDRAHCPVRVGNVLTLMRGREVIAVRIRGLPQRRGPASEAQALYERLDRPEPSFAADAAPPPPG